MGELPSERQSLANHEFDPNDNIFIFLKFGKRVSFFFLFIFINQGKM